MKKILILLGILLCLTFQVQAKNYAKINKDSVQKAQKFAPTTTYVQSETRIQSQNYTPIKNIKDPKLLKTDDYETLTNEQIKEKIKEDAKIYKQYNLYSKKQKPDNFNKQAYKRDYKKIYQVADKLIRSNNLGFMNWRIVFVAKPKEFNASSSDTNCITINSSVFDTFTDNADAMAFVIAHEMGHSLLGHQQRKAEMMKRTYELYKYSMATGGTGLSYTIKKQTDLKEFRNMEYAADLEGAKLLVKAGYNLDSAAEAIAFINTFGTSRAEYRSSHPITRKRVENIAQNRKYFPEEQWREWGLYNWYNTEPLTARLSSDRNSIVMGRSEELSTDKYYQPETFEQIYIRYAYKSYVYGEFKKALKYLKKVISCNPNNFAAYLYASYACEYLYEQTSSESYKNDAKKYIEEARRLAPHNKYVIEQIEQL